MSVKETYDHLGNKFDSVSDMCEYYNIKLVTYESRVHSGWSLEEALTKPVDTSKRNVNTGSQVIDHLGNVYRSVKEMCDNYGISLTLYCKRKARGWTLEQTLTMNTTRGVKRFKNRYVDHLGNHYNSLDEMCRSYHTTPGTYRDRLEKGMTIEECLTTDSNKELRTDPEGNVYKNIHEMCDAYDIKYETYRQRRKHGYSKEEALTNKLRDTSVKDHLGKVYNSLRSMAKAYGVNYSTLCSRLSHGLTIEEALTKGREVSATV